ncbi:hypothetical protein D3C85_1276370 [compost metagenome]
MAVAGAVINIVRLEDLTGELLNDIILFIGDFGGRDESQLIAAILFLNRSKTLSYQRQCLIPGRFNKGVPLTDERCGQTLFTVHEVPTEFPFHTGRDGVDRCIVGRLNLQNCAPFGPDFK